MEFFKKTFLFRTPVRKQRRRFDLAWFVVFVFINHHETSLATTGGERERDGRRKGENIIKSVHFTSASARFYSESLLPRVERHHESIRVEALINKVID